MVDLRDLNATLPGVPARAVVRGEPVDHPAEDGARAGCAARGTGRAVVDRASTRGSSRCGRTSRLTPAPTLPPPPLPSSRGTPASWFSATATATVRSRHRPGRGNTRTEGGSRCSYRPERVDGKRNTVHPRGAEQPSDQTFTAAINALQDSLTLSTPLWLWALKRRCPPRSAARRPLR